MRIKISTPYDKDVLNKYPILKKYNPVVDYPYKNKSENRITIELKSIEDLLKLHNELRQDLIIRNEDYCFDNESEHCSILIYDDYIE